MALPDEASKDDTAKFKTTNLFQNVPQERAPSFFNVVPPELEEP